MKYHKLLKFLLCFSAGAVSALSLSGTAHSSALPSEGDRLFQSMIFHDSSGKAWTLKQWVQTHKKPIMVVAWAKWCGPCMREMPYVQKMRATMQRHLDVLPIAVEPPPLGHKYELPGIQIPLFYSNNLSKMMSDLELTGIPAVLVYSRQGVLLHKEIGAKDWNEERNIQLLKGLLKVILDKKSERQNFQSLFRGEKNQALFNNTGSQGLFR